MANQEPSVTTFIVRLSRDAAGVLRGVVERAATGAKQPVEGCQAIGSVIAAMLEAERPVLAFRPNEGEKVS